MTWRATARTRAARKTAVRIIQGMPVIQGLIIQELTVRVGQTARQGQIRL